MSAPRTGWLIRRLKEVVPGITGLVCLFGFGFGVPLALGYLVVVPLERWLEPPPINRATCERVLARWQYDHGHNPFESCVQLKNGGWCVYNDQDEGRCILP
jgi:hypothetical protein